MKRTTRHSASILVLLFLFLFPAPALCQSPALDKGIQQYKEENYIEAIRFLEKARKEDPKSSSAAFFLGLSYKQLMDHEKALENFRDAVTLKPRIKEALVELIAVLYELDQNKEAKKWIEVAEKEEILPAKTAFLKGLILRKEGKPQEALEALEKAKALDETLAQSADVQIALCHVELGKYKAAKERLQIVIQRDPRSSLAGFARQYQAMVEKQLEAERPLRLTLAVHGQYDTNVILQPTESALAPSIIGAKDEGLSSTLILDYVPKLQGPWLFNGQYAYFGQFYDDLNNTHNSISNSISVIPGYNFGKSALNLSAKYIYSVVNPSYQKYLGYLNVGPLYRAMLAENQILEIFGAFTWKDYLQPPLSPDEDRDSKGYDFYVSWVWMYKENGFLNLRYNFTHDNAVGTNWDNRGFGFSANAAIPMIQKLQLQLTGSVFRNDYANVSTVFGVHREDTNYTGQIGLNWEFYKNTDLVLQFTAINVNSNISIYDYNREIYSLGIEYRY